MGTFCISQKCRMSPFCYGGFCVKIREAIAGARVNAYTSASSNCAKDTLTKSTRDELADRGMTRPHDGHRVLVHQRMRHFVTDDFRRSLHAFSQFGPAPLEVMGIGRKHEDDSALQELPGAQMRTGTESASHGTGSHLQQTTHLDERFNLGQIPDDIFVAFRVRNDRPDLLFQKRLNQVIRSERNVAMRELEQQYPVAVHYPQKRQLVSLKQRQDLG